MIHQLKLRIRTEPGALQRVLVFASKRGFEPVGMSVRRDGTLFTMDFEVESDRPRSILVRTLQQLFDVEEVE
jgi:acetolactate synthase regulatory subunit